MGRRLIEWPEMVHATGLGGAVNPQGRRRLAGLAAGFALLAMIAADYLVTFNASPVKPQGLHAFGRWIPEITAIQDHLRTRCTIYALVAVGIAAATFWPTALRGSSKSRSEAMAVLGIAGWTWGVVTGIAAVVSRQEEIRLEVPFAIVLIPTITLMVASVVGAVTTTAWWSFEEGADASPPALLGRGGRVVSRTAITLALLALVLVVLTIGTGLTCGVEAPEWAYLVRDAAVIASLGAAVVGALAPVVQRPLAGLICVPLGLSLAIFVGLAGQC